MLALFIGLTACKAPIKDAETQLDIEQAVLSNGLEIFVIKHNRAPTVTHMLWYKIGGADEPSGQSGIAHLFEHLMFKATKNLAAGEFSKTVADLGGRDNAMTLPDLTAYFQRIPKEHLAKVMEMEAERMVNLQLTRDDFTTEKRVVLEERSLRVDQHPARLADEQVMKQLYGPHPYAIPTIGWRAEVEALPYEAAQRFYKSYYAPDNAMLLVVGDTQMDIVKPLAEKFFGSIPASGQTRPARAPIDFSEARDIGQATQALRFSDPRFQQFSWQRTYRIPPRTAENRRDVAALAVAIDILGGSTTSRLYDALVRPGFSQTVSADISYYRRDAGEISISAIVAAEEDLAKIGAQIERVLAEFQSTPVSALAVERSVSKLAASYLYEQDGQASLAFNLGLDLALGLQPSVVTAWASDLAEVTPQDVSRVAQDFLRSSQSRTAHMGVAP